MIKYPTPRRAHNIELRVIAALTHVGRSNHLEVQKAMLQLDSDCFYTPENRQMFEIINHLYQCSSDFSFLAFLGHLPPECHMLISDFVASNTFSVSRLDDDVQTLIKCRTHRNQIRILVDAMNQSEDETRIEDALTTLSDSLQSLNSVAISRQELNRNPEMILNEFFSRPADEVSDFAIDIPGLPRVPNRAMITIAGRSGHGKTFIALEIMDKIMKAFPDKQGIYFNLEMDEVVILERLAILNGYQGYSRHDLLTSAADCLTDKKLYIYTKEMPTIDEIETQCSLSALQSPVGVIVVDYLGLVRSKSKAERHDLTQSDIAKRLAAIAMRLNCVVLCLIQVNREIKNRPVGDRCPVVTDAAESMGSVHSSSWWIGIDQPQNDTDDPNFKDLFMIQNRKNRGDGGLFRLNLKFKDGKFSRWVESFQPSLHKNLPRDGF